MHVLHPLTAFAALLVSPFVFAAPPVAVAVAAAPAKPVKVGLVAVQATAAEVVRARTHVFKPANVVRAIPEDLNDGPSLFAGKPPKLPPQKPKLNVVKFGETIHAAFKDKVRGYALGLRKNGQPMQTLIWDSARAGQQGTKGWTLDTRMHVASVSKLVTAIVATKMLDERGLGIDAAIGSYLPTYWDEGNGVNAVTFRKLLTHRSGFTIHDGDFVGFKRQVEQGVETNPSGVYTNGAFSLVRVLNATMTGAVSKGSDFSPPVQMSAAQKEGFNDAIWDLKSTNAFLAYAQAKVFTPAGVGNVSPDPTANGAIAYAGKTDTAGWDSGDVATQIGGAGFRLSVNEVLDVMGTFRRKGTIVSPAKAKESIEARLGLDREIDTPAGKIYDKNGMWRTGKTITDDVEQSVAVYLQEEMECVVLVNSWIGNDQASLRNTVRDAYVLNLE